MGTALQSVFLSAWATTVLVTSLGHHPHAAAQGVAEMFRGPVTTTVSSARDPWEFETQLDVIPPPPAVPLTLEEGIVYDLVRHTRTLRHAEASLTAQVICDEAQARGYDPLLFLAVIRIESAYDHLAVSPAGAEGLMQLMPDTAAWLAQREDLDWSDRHSFEPTLNVRLGVRYLVELLHRFRSLDAALTAYNRGPTNTRAILRKYGNLPEHVRNFYARKVLQQYQMLRAAYGELPLA